MRILIVEDDSFMQARIHETLRTTHPHDKYDIVPGYGDAINRILRARKFGFAYSAGVMDLGIAGKEGVQRSDGGMEVFTFWFATGYMPPIAFYSVLSLDEMVQNLQNPDWKIAVGTAQPCGKGFTVDVTSHDTKACARIGLFHKGTAGISDVVQYLCDVAEPTRPQPAGATATPPVNSLHKPASP